MSAALVADGFPARYQCFFAWETSIPLLPLTALVYMSLNIMAIPLVLTFPTVSLIRPVLLTVAAELLVAVVIFCLWPLEAGFHDPPASGALSVAQLLAFRHNYFPSLHVALAFTGALTLGRWPYFLWASLIALSTLTTHQHHLVDVVGGIALALAGYSLVYRRLVPTGRADVGATPI